MERLEQGIPLTPPPMSSAFPYKDEDGPVLTGRGGGRPGIYLVNSLILVDRSLSEDIHYFAGVRVLVSSWRGRRTQESPLPSFV